MPSTNCYRGESEAEVDAGGNSLAAEFAFLTDGSLQVTTRNSKITQRKRGELEGIHVAYLTKNR